MIEVKNISKSYQTTNILNNLSLIIPQQRLTTIIGPNGAGKSTLIGMISRIIPPTSGDVLINGVSIFKQKSNELAKKLSILKQDNHILLKLTVVELVSFGRYPHSFGKLTPIDHVKIKEAITYMDLESLQHQLIHTLSGGERQRAYIAMILAQDTDYIILDEPLNSVDIKHAKELMTRIRRLVDELGKTVVVVLHDINFASSYSDYIIALKRGDVVFSGTPDDLMHQHILSQIYDIPFTIAKNNNKKIGTYY